MTDEELAAIRARAEVATPGPWFYNRTHDSIETTANAEDVVVGDGWGDGVRNEADADFIIHAREDVPALVDEVERLRAENEELTETIRQARNVQAGIFRLFPEVAAAVLAALDINEARALLPHSKGAMGDEP